MDRQGMFHPNTDLAAFAHGELGDPHIIESASGIRLRDQRGRELIDAFASLWCVNVGYGRREIADAMHAQTLAMAYYHTHAAHSNEPIIRLTDRVLRMAPEGMSKIFWGVQGSDATETEVKIVWYYHRVLGRPQKRKIIARHRAYHGLTVMAGSLSGLPAFHDTFGLPIGPVLHTVAPYFYWRDDPDMSEREYAADCAARLDALIEAEGPDTVAAFIGEPVMGVGGILVPPDGYWPAIREVCDRHDVLLVADEVVTGFGRLGVDFGSDLYGIRPDLITIAKGITSGYFPLAGSIVNDKVWAVLEEGSRKLGPFSHGYTYAGHAVGAAVAMANLDIIEREGLVENARTTGAYLNRRLAEALGDHPLVGEVRGAGLLACVELVADRARRIGFDPALGVGRRVAAACRERGLIVRPLPAGDMIGFSPPLVITPEEVDEVVSRARAAVDDVAGALAREGLLKHT
ncbi:MAG: aminotransferase class III-fold pyridoxal phosphate-dependent enzyme [Ectothiorhodospiraceae bacterium]|nr:aminotransferase class III-fold pyridoxal phosphate-dependent enzyme [Ectothiorhodospiraceae bacterium]